MFIMPRKSRIDAPGALHHIIARGIERFKIFRDNTDRNFFLDRADRIIRETIAWCFCWALIPNHFHFDNRLWVARRRYRAFVKKSITEGRRSDLTGGGLIRSSGGWWQLNKCAGPGYSRKQMSAFWVMVILLRRYFRKPGNIWKKGIDW